MAASPHTAVVNGGMNNITNGDQFTGIKIKPQAAQQDQVDRLKQAHKLRSNQNASPDPLTYLSQQPTAATTGVVKSTHTLD